MKSKCYHVHGTACREIASVVQHLANTPLDDANERTKVAARLRNVAEAIEQGANNDAEGRA